MERYDGGYGNQSKDSVFKRGTLVTGINGLSNVQLQQKCLVTTEDGKANNVNFRLSNNFPYYPPQYFGFIKTYTVNYIEVKTGRRSKLLCLYLSLSVTALKGKSGTTNDSNKRKKRSALFKQTSALSN